MLFQYDHPCSAMSARRVVVGVLCTQTIMAGQVGGMTAKDNAVAYLAWAEGERLKEPIKHASISSAFSHRCAVAVEIICRKLGERKTSPLLYHDARYNCRIE